MDLVSFGENTVGLPISSFLRGSFLVRVSASSSSCLSHILAGTCELRVFLSILELFLDGLLDGVELRVGIEEKEIDLALDLREYLVVISLKSDGANSLFYLSNHVLEHRLSAEIFILWLRL
jgi:hypothetical protein